MPTVTMTWLGRTVLVLFMVLIAISSHWGCSAFSVTFPENSQMVQLPGEWNDGNESFEEDKRMVEDSEELDYGDDNTGDNTDHVDQYIDLFKRYSRGWGHQTRFPWKRLPDRMCYRQPCKSHKYCCQQFNLCDPSAKVCVDCWYGSKCRSERDCCMNYPYCARIWRRNQRSGYRYVADGKCVRKL